MRKVVRKQFWAWDFDKEEKWLNEMAAKGLALISVGFCRYEFEDCVPGEYKICLELLESRLTSVEETKCIEFLEETGAEHVGTYHRWQYFRKRGAGEPFKLFSDYASRIEHLTRVIRFIAILWGINLFSGCYNLFFYFVCNSQANLIGIVNLLIAALITVGLLRLLCKRKKLKSEQQIYE